LATDVFHTRIFCLTHPSDRDEYEAIKQDVEVDGGKRYRVLSQVGSWTREGDYMVALEYIEIGSQAPERY
jgi:hypothetical protein